MGAGRSAGPSANVTFVRSDWGYRHLVAASWRPCTLMARTNGGNDMIGRNQRLVVGVAISTAVLIGMVGLAGPAHAAPALTPWQLLIQHWQISWMQFLENLSHARGNY